VASDESSMPTKIITRSPAAEDQQGAEDGEGE
jgi:hypothetical protein